VKANVGKKVEFAAFEEIQQEGGSAGQGRRPGTLLIKGGMKKSRESLLVGGKLLSSLSRGHDIAETKRRGC